LSGWLLFLILAGTILVVVALQARWAHEASDEVEASRTEMKVRHQALRLTSADPDEVRDASNVLLSLGPGVLPTLCDLLKQAAEEPDDKERSGQAMLEDVIASFGPRAVAPVAQAMQRVVFPSAVIPSALRVVARIGPSALPMLVSELDPENAGGLGLLLHRLPGVPEPHVLRAMATADSERLRRILRVFGGVMERCPGPMVGLFDGGSARLRRGLVEFYSHWPTPLAAEILARAVDDPDPALRSTAALGLGLLAATPPEGLLLALNDPETEVRRSALIALRGLDSRGAAAPVAARLREGEPRERIEAALLLPATEGDEATTRTQLEAALSDPDGRIRLAAHTALHGPDAALDALGALGALGADDAGLHATAARCVADQAPRDVRAQERAILLLESPDAEVRAMCCAALAAAGLRDQPGRFGAVVRASGDGALEHFFLRVAALRSGALAVPPLIRIVRTARPAVALLAAELAAATGTDESLDGLLRSLPHHRGSLVGMVIRAHAAAFGDAAIEAAVAVLGSDLGLTPPATCEFLLQYASPQHAASLLEVIDRSDVHRTAVLAALETLAATHPEAVLEALSERRGLASEELLRRRIGLQ